MPPQGESTGIAFEDALLFARTLAKYFDRPQALSQTFQAYETIRRSKVHDAYQEANSRWENVRDSGYLMNKLKEWMIPYILWWTEDKRNKAFMFDAQQLEIP